jgi:hypothetical protein
LKLRHKQNSLFLSELDGWAYLSIADISSEIQ